MMAAGGYKIFKAFHHPVAGTPQENWSLLILTTIISAIVSFIAVKWLLRYVQSHSFNGFGWYRIAVGGGLLALVFCHLI
jgi:undecaprenyl-diphosphatase